MWGTRFGWGELMKNTLRNIALQTAIAVLCGLIALNGYLISRNLKGIERNAASRADASARKAELAATAFDLQTMETSQRGYLLTGDESYLQPYNDAQQRLTAHFAHLRSGVTGKDRSLENELENVAAAKMAEMEETIRLRQRGYRHRAFVIVDSNRGQELMQQARSMLDNLLAAQTANVDRYEGATRASVVQAIAQSTLASAVLLLVTLVTFLAFNGYRKRLERGSASQAEVLGTTTRQLEQVTGTMFHQFRRLASEMQSHANALLEVYGGFLPRQGQEKAERIEAGAGEMISLLDGVPSGRPRGRSAEVVEVRPANAVSA